MALKSLYCVECICGYDIESETNILICPGCQRLVVIEWPAQADSNPTPDNIELPIAVLKTKEDYVCFPETDRSLCERPE
jgi:hypothetical protein